MAYNLPILDGGYLDVSVKGLLNGREYATPVLNTFFKRKVYTPNDVVVVPKEVTDYDDILPLIDKNGSVPVAKGEWGGEDYNYYVLQAFGEVKVVTAQEIEDYRKQLMNLEGVAYQAKKVEIVNRIMGRTIQKVNATRERMACQALSGKITDKNGNVLFTFDIPAANNLGTKALSTNGDGLAVTLQEMKNKAIEATNYRGGFGYVVGRNALLKIMKNDDFKSAMSYAGVGANDQTQIVSGWFFGNEPYVVANDWFYSKTGKKQFFNDDTLMLAPIDAFGEFYGNVFTKDGAHAEIPYIDTYDINNPDGLAIRTQVKTAPIVTVPNGIVTATIS